MSRRLLAWGTAAAVSIPAVSWVSVETTSTPGFCASCHEMESVERAWRASEHFPKDGHEGAECRDCHIPSWTRPHEVIAVKMRDGAKDVWFHLFPRRDLSDPASYYALKASVRDTMTDAPCVSCHEKVLSPDTDLIEVEGHGDEPVRIVRGLHSSDEARRQRCVGCHKHMGHTFYD